MKNLINNHSGKLIIASFIFWILFGLAYYFLAVNGYLPEAYNFMAR